MFPQTYGNLYFWLREQLSFRENAENESRWLIEALADSEFHLLRDKNFPTTELLRYTAAIEKLRGDMPFQYVIGFQDFYGLPFKTTADVLVPRPETEVLVETALNWSKGKNISALDICTGSGCIIITMAKYLTGDFSAVDISAPALAVAKENAKHNDVSVNFYCGDLFEPVDNEKKFDIITANPPYLTKGEMAAIPRVLTFEPPLALFGGEDGLDLCRKLLEKVSYFLKPQSLFLMEIGEEQGDAVLEMAVQNFTKSEIMRDLAGRPRFLYAENI